MSSCPNSPLCHTVILYLKFNVQFHMTAKFLNFIQNKISSKLPGALSAVGGKRAGCVSVSPLHSHTGLPLARLPLASQWLSTGGKEGSIRKAESSYVKGFDGTTTKNVFLFRKDKVESLGWANFFLN